MREDDPDEVGTRRAPYRRAGVAARFASHALAPQPGSMVVHVCGAAASGKTTLARALAERLDLPIYGIDQERLRLLPPGRHWLRDDLAAWLALATLVNGASPCIVETSGLHPADATLLAGRSAYRIRCHADAAMRAVRLQQRMADGYPLARRNPGYVARLLAQPELTVEANVAFDGTRPDAAAVDAVAAGVAAWLAERGGR